MRFLRARNGNRGHRPPRTRARLRAVRRNLLARRSWLFTRLRHLGDPEAGEARRPEPREVLPYSNRSPRRSSAAANPLAPRAPRRQSDQIPHAVFMGREARFSIVVAWRSRAKNLLGEAFSGGPIASRHSTVFSSLRSPSGSCSGRSSGRGRSARQWRSQWLRPPHIPGNPSRTRAKAATRWRLAHTAP